MASRVGLMGCFITVFALLGGATAATYQVGDSYGWHVPPSNSTDFYANWASNHTFQIGDSVAFVWTNFTHNVDNVTKENYDSCTSGGQPIAHNFTVNFTSNGTFYYICSIGDHCQRGQKVTFVVVDGVSGTNTGRGLSPSLNVGALTAVLSAIAIFFLGYT